jgi:hypothetical protein
MSKEFLLEEFFKACLSSKLLCLRKVATSSSFFSFFEMGYFFFYGSHGSLKFVDLDKVTSTHFFEKKRTDGKKGEQTYNYMLLF